MITDETEIKILREDWMKIKINCKSFIVDGTFLDIYEDINKRYIYINYSNHPGTSVVADIIYDPNLDGGVILEIKNKSDVEIINKILNKILSK